jgi:hypothetical protein
VIERVTEESDILILGEQPVPLTNERREQEKLEGVVTQFALVQFDPNNHEVTVALRAPKNYVPTLLRKVISSIEDPIHMQYQVKFKESDVEIPCLHCVRKDPLVQPYCFSIANCVRALSSGDPFVYCQGIRAPSRAVRVSAIVPDLALAEAPQLSNVEVEEKIGEGGFGIVYKGRYANRVIAVKEISLMV